MAKLVDVPDLGSGAARRVGSSPITRTKSPNESLDFFLVCRFPRYFGAITRTTKALTKVRAFFMPIWLIICLQFVVYETVQF